MIGGMPRSYSSPVRAEQAARTRRAVITAARELFLSAGWNATTMAGVAEHARVARQTVYDLFGGKLTLLDAVIDVDLAGDDAPVAAADRARFAAMGQGTRAERLVRAARWLAETQIRAVPL